MVRYGFKNFPFKKIVLELIVHVIYFCHLLWKNSPTVFIKILENSVFFNEKKNQFLMITDLYIIIFCIK